jgi:hypothetical protein
MRLLAIAAPLTALALCLPAAASQPLPTYDKVGLKWKNPPTVVDMARYYPVRARAKQIGRGMAEVACSARNTSGDLNCQVVSESPERAGFGASALAVMSRARVEAVDGGDPRGRAFGFRLKFGTWGGADLPASFQPGPGLNWSRFPTMGKWSMSGQDRYETFSADFDCTARANGRLTCTPTGGTPDQPKFQAAAIEAMAKARVTSANGAPVEGARFSWTVSVQRQNWCSPGREEIFQDSETPGQIGRCFPSQVQVR